MRDEEAGFYKAFGKRIARRRKALMLTQRQVGNMLVPPMSNCNLNRIEHGIQRAPAHTVVQLAEILHVTPDVLLGCADDENPPYGFDEFME